MTVALADLLITRTAEQEEAALLSVLKGEDFPVTDWHSGGGAVELIRAIGFLLADHGKAIPIVTAGGNPLLAKLLADPTWLDLLGEQFFDLPRGEPTYTKQLCRISCAAGAGPVTINAGFTARAAGTKNLYVYQGSPVSIADADYEDIELMAESPGSLFADPVGSIIETITSISGVTINNPARPFGRLVGANATRNAANQGSGTVLPSGTPATARLYTVIVTGSGAAGSGGAIRIEWLQAGVVASASVTPIPTSYGVGDGVILGFSNGSGAGFIKNDRHTFETLGSAITANGVDSESQESYAARMLGRWPSLGLNIVADKYEAWIRQCSQDNALGVEKISMAPSSTVAGQTDITVATATGSPSGPAITTMQNYVNARDGITDTANVAGATNQNITLSGSVYLKADVELAAKAAADEAWRNYIADLPIGGDRSTGYPGVVRLAELEQAVMDGGAIDKFDLRLNGVDMNCTLTLTQVAVIPAGQLPSEALTWVTVP